MGRPLPQPYSAVSTSSSKTVLLQPRRFRPYEKRAPLRPPRLSGSDTRRAATRPPATSISHSSSPPHTDSILLSAASAFAWYTSVDLFASPTPTPPSSQRHPPAASAIDIACVAVRCTSWSSST
jgi:hypothetical protein